MYAQDGRLRRIDDGRGQHRPEDAAVGNGESSAGQLFKSQLAVAGSCAEVGDLLLDFSDGKLVGVTQDGYHQAARAAYGDADIEVAVIDDVLAVHRCIDNRIFLERGDSGLDEERCEAQLDSVFFLELILVFFTQIQDALHVDFVEGRQDGVIGLRLQQALGHTGTQAAHGYALLGTAIQRQGRWRDRRGGLGGWSGGTCLQGIALGDAATAAGAFDGSGIDAFFSQDLAGGGRCYGRGGRRAGCGSGSRRGFGGGGGRRSGRGLAFGVDARQDFARSDHAAVAL